MPEIDLRGNYLWTNGYPREEQLVSRELYQLMNIFAAAPAIARRSGGAGGHVYEWAIRSFEYLEISRILVSVSALLRNDWDANRSRITSKLGDTDQQVGVFTEDLDRPRQRQPLLIRESFNKVLHASTINLDRSKGPSIYDGHVRPKVHLYGEYRGRDWKATIEVFRWIECVHVVC